MPPFAELSSQVLIHYDSADCGIKCIPSGSSWTFDGRDGTAPPICLTSHTPRGCFLKFWRQASQGWVALGCGFEFFGSLKNEFLGCTPTSRLHMTQTLFSLSMHCLHFQHPWSRILYCQRWHRCKRMDKLTGWSPVHTFLSSSNIFPGQAYSEHNTRVHIAHTCRSFNMHPFLVISEAKS